LKSRLVIERLTDLSERDSHIQVLQAVQALQLFPDRVDVYVTELVAKLNKLSQMCPVKLKVIGFFDTHANQIIKAIFVRYGHFKIVFKMA
jgi:hypothetical protein